ncbi:MAG: UDP-N-acetylglucosamine 1-carboxyvinyltransferase [Pseudonocardiales bacterium]|nr:MAG: UDP-N-acetylglucosamine 1-carboxyvinyltransferase [Pseudonocardiales bacterium]
MPHVELFRITGGARLVGDVPVSGAKNSVLKLMAAALLAEGRTVLTHTPQILDVAIMGEVLRRLGCAVTIADGAITIDCPARPGSEADYDLVRRMRAAICVLGPLLARTGAAKVALPGGDAIGSRGLDMHIAGLTRLGAEVTSEHGFVMARGTSLHGATVWLDFPSVGATEQILMASVLAKGTTVIDNAAREPEIIDICTMLTSMGARIGGAGSSTIEVEGVEELEPVQHRPVADRIVAGTWAIGAVMTRGDVTVRGADWRHLEITLDKLVTAGAAVEPLLGSLGFRVAMEQRPRAIDMVTLPYPGFPTDLLPMAIALASVADGASMVTENVFDARFMFVNELTRLGADVRTDGHHAVIRGRERLSGAPVRATDIRAGAGLVLAALCADGVSEVSDVSHIDRGYPSFVDHLRGLGAEIARVDVPDPDFPLGF